jgi:hypothetical protein
MVTGDYYYMSELAFSASYNELMSNEAYRGFSRGLIDVAHGQVRAKAWVLREMADAAWLLPQTHPLKSEFIADVENSLADWNAKYTDNPNANALGLMDNGAIYSINGGQKNAMAPWQHNFLTWSAGHATELGFTGAAAFRDWLAKFEIGLMTDWLHDAGRGFCWLQASAYNIQVKDAAGQWLPSYSAVYAATYPTLPALACNSTAMLTELAKVRNLPVQAYEMAGYPTSNTGFPANFQIGIAMAADTGLPDAMVAWNLFDSRSRKPAGTEAYNNYPNFALLPRSLPEASGDQAPIINPVPPTTPTTPVESTTPDTTDTPANPPAGPSPSTPTLSTPAPSAPAPSTPVASAPTPTLGGLKLKRIGLDPFFRVMRTPSKVLTYLGTLRAAATQVRPVTSPATAGASSRPSQAMLTPSAPQKPAGAKMLSVVVLPSLSRVRDYDGCRAAKGTSYDANNGRPLVSICRRTTWRAGEPTPVSRQSHRSAR